MRECILSFNPAKVEDPRWQSPRHDLFSQELTDYLISTSQLLDFIWSPATNKGTSRSYVLDILMQLGLHHAWEWWTCSLHDLSHAQAWSGIEDLLARPW